MIDSTTFNFRKKYNIYLNKDVLFLIMRNYLTDRQYYIVYEILILNKSQQEVADILHLSQPTISRHLRAAIKTIKHLVVNM